MKTQIKKLMAGVLGSVAVLSTGVMFSADAAARDLKLAMQTNPGTAQYDGVEKFAALVKAKSGGSLTVKIFGGGALGGDLQVVSSLQGGTVELSQMNASLLNGLAKEFSVLDFPFLFDNEKEAHTVMDGPIGKKLMDKLPEKGIVGLAYPELGFRHISNNKRPVKKVEDLAGLKIRVIQTPVYVDMMNALGANATPLPFPEVYNALEQKAVDGATNPLVTIPVMKFDEVQKYLTLTRHQYNPQIIIMSKKAWDKLTPAEQKVIQESANEARDFERQVSAKKNAEALEHLKKKLEVTELSAEEMAKMREKVKPVIEKYTKELGEPFVKEVYAEVAKVRGAK
ncbi:TRAP transporter substrate-binding protein [Aromatoleum toluolicum]|uniref:DctP family TRAP transporter solute-binding subunit n=1 Tax=Aromatoleum toluolicum TaxID=90060 RepID=A0ABX1NEB1_9RHOO|nr:TRAP transporter substrate-binding protein [Aromatoleum toluolicum]NMF97632.1 TRAP transporter substrate-binding protein [Aromatoleum toluolicum]